MLRQSQRQAKGYATRICTGPNPQSRILDFPAPSAQQDGSRRTSPAKEHPQAGFSLLEVLVVLFIIGVAVTFATLSLGTDHRSRLLRVEAERLAHLIQIASQQAVMQSRQFGLDVSSDGYRFYIFNQHKWTPLEGDDLLRQRHLPAGFRLGLDLGAPTPTLASSSMADSGGGDSGKKTRQPPILMLSSGEMVPFKLTLSEDRHPSDAYVVQGSFDGVVKVSSANAK